MERKPTGNHLFDKACLEHHIEHRFIPPRHPQTNGMVERFNGRISDVLATTRFNSAADLEATMFRYAHLRGGIPGKPEAGTEGRERSAVETED